MTRIIKKNIDILLVGTSIIRRWNISENNDFNKSLKIVNLGINKFSEDMISDEYINIISKYKPKNIIFYCGGNDIRSDIENSICIKNIQYFLLNLKKIYKNNVNFIFISILKNPINTLYNNNIDIVNKSIKEFIDNYNKLYNRTYNIYLNFIDMNQYLDDSKYFMKDNIHLKKNGYKILIKKIFDLI